MRVLTARRHARAVPWAALLAMVVLWGGGHALAQSPSDGEAVVRADGDCLRLRGLPSLSGDVLDCLPEGTTVELLGSEVEANGYRWQLVRVGDETGWATDRYLVAASTVSAPSDESAAPVEALVEAPEPPSATILNVPVTGGLTIGPAGIGDPAAVADAQPFQVMTVSSFDSATQRWLVYIPGAPAIANSLGSDDLEADSIVTIRRAGDRPLDLPSPPSTSPGTTFGVPNVLTIPPLGGLTQGIAGTNDPALLAAAQPFGVTSISMFDVASQTWLVFIPGAPTLVNTLHTGTLDTESAVTIRRALVDVALSEAPTAPVDESPDEDIVATQPPAEEPTATVGPPPDEAPPDEPVDDFAPTEDPTLTEDPAPTEPSPTPTPPPSDAARTAEAPITYYYCSQGTNPASIGDGGGFCGYTASGEPVQPGGASCAAENLGQRFRIVGDPLERVYTCIDTGGAVYDEHRDIWFENSDDGYAWWLAVGTTATIEILSD